MSAAFSGGYGLPSPIPASFNTPSRSRKTERVSSAKDDSPALQWTLLWISRSRRCPSIRLEIRFRRTVHVLRKLPVLPD